MCTTKLLFAFPTVGKVVNEDARPSTLSFPSTLLLPGFATLATSYNAGTMRLASARRAPDHVFVDASVDSDSEAAAWSLAAKPFISNLPSCKSMRPKRVPPNYSRTRSHYCRNENTVLVWSIYRHYHYKVRTESQN